MNKAVIEVHYASELVEPQRIQEYGVGIFQAAFTRSALKKVLKKGFVTVDGNPATTATFILGGEKIELCIPAPQSPSKQLIFSLQVLFEDEYLAVIDKPPGILVSGNSFMTVANALPQNLQQSPLLTATKPWPVHRLDYATTGVLLIGKTSESIRRLSSLFAEKRIAKTYFAITIGVMPKNGRIQMPIDGKNATTIFKVIGSVFSQRFAQLNLVELTLETGRRHQLRKHLAHLGNPILGDKDYFNEGLILTGKGLYLHAYKLVFVHPFSNQATEVSAQFPKKFLKIFPSITSSY